MRDGQRLLQPVSLEAGFDRPAKKFTASQDAGYNTREHH
jgi:hypothetical protein